MTGPDRGDNARGALDQSRAEMITRPPGAPLMGVQVTTSDIPGIQNYLAQMIRESQGGYVSCANAYSLGLADDDPNFRSLLNAAVVVTTDGMPVVWALRLMGHSCERVHNDDLVLACCDRFPDWRHFLVGGRVGQPEAVAEALQSRFPKIEIVGTHPTPERPVPEHESRLMVQKIRESGANIVWAALGTPQQDYWMQSVTDYLDVPLVGCGSLFDLLAGRTRPTPGWMKRAGLQWLFRLAQEPGRLMYRYARYNTKFIVCVFRQYLDQICRN